MDDYWVVRGDTIEEAVKRVRSMKKDELVSLIVNNRLNNFVAKYADFEDDEKDTEGYGKRVPYIGWFWRSTDFVNKRIAIGSCGDFIGVMENNKWDYPERYLTPEEADRVISIIWEAKKLSEEGGSLLEIHNSTKSKLSELWDVFREFRL